MLDYPMSGMVAGLAAVGKEDMRVLEVKGEGE
jgi:hypothetical protein